jgi:integral membrane protein (TIGR01906 family)
MNRIAVRAASVVVGLAAAVVIVTVAVAPFLTPQFVAFEQGRAGSAALTGYASTGLRSATDAILHDLVIGPPAFDVAVDGAAVLDPREQSHMRDVRSVFLGLWAVGLASVVILVVAAFAMDRVGLWRILRRAAIALASVVVALGVVAIVAFDALFDSFHALLFPAGSYTFDTGTERLVQLFPFTFWQETALAVGTLIVVLSLGLAAVARRRERAIATDDRRRGATVRWPAHETSR